jgi:pullulanase/glycogen debranching enzyme
MALIDTPTMIELTEMVRKQSGQDMLIYGEPWQAGGSVLSSILQTNIGDQKGLAFAIFNDRIRTAIKGGSDDNTKGFATGQSGREAAILRGIQGSVHDFTSSASESINYVTAHDNLNLWDKIAFSLGAKDLKTNPYGILDANKTLLENDAVKAALLADGIILTSQGIPFFQAGDEMLRTKYGDHNSYASSDEINRIRWENAGTYREVVEYHAGLIRLRKEHPAFRMNSKADIERSVEILSAGEGVVSFVLNNTGVNGDSWDAIFAAYNGSIETKTVPLPLTAAVWHQVVNEQRAGTETLADITGGAVTLPPLSMTVLHD